MRSGELSGLVPCLLSPPWSYFQAFSTLKKFRLSQGFFFFLVFFPPSATSVLRQSAANNQHILNGIIALCALLPASRWKPILEWIRQIHTCFLSPHPHPATQVQFGLLWGTIASLSAFFFFCFFLLLIFFFSFLSTKWRIGFSSAVLAKADRKKKTQIPLLLLLRSGGTAYATSRRPTGGTELATRTLSPRDRREWNGTGKGPLGIKSQHYV